MVLKKFLEKLLKEPEYYMEMEGYDTRLAVGKVNDFIETMGDASISITYANKDEYSNGTERETNIIRRIHTRHAILDLNNCFDLLLQVPWFYYRIWESYNVGESLYTNKFNNFTNICRNTEGWVEHAEQNCDYKKIIRFLENQTESELLAFKTNLKRFKDTYLVNSSKDFTIRSLANHMKHNHSLKLHEFYTPTDYNVNINNHKLNLRKQELGLELRTDFYDMDNPEETLGEIRVKYWDDLYIDIEYKQGESFYAKDYMKENKRYSLEDIYSEMIKYGNALIELYEKLLAIIEPNLSLNPMLPKNPIIKHTTMNLDKYFKD